MWVNMGAADVPLRSPGELELQGRATGRWAERRAPSSACKACAALTAGLVSNVGCFNRYEI